MFANSMATFVIRLCSEIVASEESDDNIITRIRLPSRVAQTVYGTTLLAFLLLARAQFGFSVGDLYDLVVAFSFKLLPRPSRGCETEGALLADLFEGKCQSCTK